MKQQSRESDRSSSVPQHRNHQLIFGLCLFLFEVGIAVLYGFYGSAPKMVINISSIVITIMLAMLVIVGFGLYLTYLQSLWWTGLGMSLMMVCLVMQLFPLVNSFWSKIPIFHNPRFEDSFNIKGFSLFLANFDSINSTGNTITEALRCALAVVVGSSGVIGRAIPLDFLLIAIVGTVSFELNRQLTAQIGFDQFGSFTIFGFGGFFSFGIGLVFLFLQGGKKRSKTELTGSPASVTTSILGSLVIFLAIPVLAFEGDNSMKKEMFTNYTTAFYLILSMGASITTSISLSIFVNNGRLHVRDVQNGLIAGAVVGGTTSYFLTNAAFSILCGFTAAFFQPVFEHFLEKLMRKKVGFLCTYSPSVFGLQSFISGIFTVIFCARVNSGSKDNFTYTQPETSLDKIIFSVFVSMGIGFLAGLLTGLLSKVLRPAGCFLELHDRQLWVMQDGIALESSDEIVLNQRYAPQIAQKMRREKAELDMNPKSQNAGLIRTEKTLGVPEPGMLRKTTSIEDLQIELDFVDMLQVPIE